MPCNEVITSNNVLIKDNNRYLVWERKGSLSPKSREKMSHTPVKKYPDPDRPEINFSDPDRPEIKFPDPTRPENILKNVPRPRTGFGPVRSGPVRGNSGFRVAPQVFSMCMYVVFCKIDHCIHIHWCIVMGLGHNDHWVESHMWPQQTWVQRSSRGQWPLVQVFWKKGSVYPHTLMYFSNF